MRRIGYLAGGSALALALSLGLTSTAAAQSGEPTEVEAVIVTGSLIAGTPEDAALPVDVIGVEELAKQGSPSTVDLIKSLSVSNGVLGDTNQFDARAQGSEGSGSVNLRGLGPTRTLVLINGKRMAINPFALAGAGAVDTNVIPTAAVGRIEVLKDGAAATYGSDAIGGVVNFITRKNFEGLEVNGSYRSIDGSDGDYTLGVIGGWNTDRFSFMVAAGYQHRSELPLLERDWALQPFEVNPEGGWSAAGNPSTIINPIGPAVFRDAGCVEMGGRPGFSGATPVCHWQYTEWDNLVEKEDRWQIYGQIDADLTDSIKFHAEAFYAYTDVPEWKTSPSYALLATPDGVTLPPAFAAQRRYYVPAANPGLVDYAAEFGGAFPFGVMLAANRPYAMGGNPMFDYGPSTGERTYDAFRLAADLSGDLDNGIHWSVGAQYSEETGYRTGYDTIVSRYQLALRGYGSKEGDSNQCTAAETANYTTNAGNAALGCYWINPFSTAIPSNKIHNVANPNFNPAVANDVDVTRWFFQKLATEQTSTLFVVDGLLSGQFEHFELGGGNVAWALGAQYRKSGFESWYNDISNREKNPCLNTPINGDMSCAAPQGPFSFLGVGQPVDLSQDVRAVFGEIVFPFSENFNATLAARFEDYGGTVGNTFDPKLSMRWQVVDQFALRGSVGTTFRAPTAGQVDGSNFVTSLQSILGTFRAVDIYGNQNLKPETALTYSVGAIFETDHFKATLDYWNFDFKDPITTEPVGGLMSVLAPGGVLNCAHPLIDRITFSPNTCAIANIARLETQTVNGADVQTSGLDLLADYTFDDVFGGTFTIGTSVTYVLEYKTDDTFVEGFLVTPAFDAVGQLNYQTTAYPLPQWKGNLYFEWNSGPHNARWTIRHIDSYTDQRSALYCTALVAPAPAGQCVTQYRNADATGTPLVVTGGQTIDSFTTHDFTYRVFLPWDTTATFTVENIFDEDPPFARLDLSYDPFTASGLGRTWKFSLSKKF